MKMLGLAALFAAGVLLAGVAASVGNAQGTETTITLSTTSTELETTTVEETTTVPTTVTTSAVTPTTAPTTTATTSEGNRTPTWVWILLGVLGAAVVGLLVALLNRRDPTAPRPPGPPGPP
jgi:hypothetical protein